MLRSGCRGVDLGSRPARAPLTDSQGRVSPTHGVRAQGVIFKVSVSPRGYFQLTLESAATNPFAVVAFEKERTKQINIAAHFPESIFKFTLIVFTQMLFDESEFGSDGHSNDNENTQIVNARTSFERKRNVRGNSPGAASRGLATRQRCRGVPLGSALQPAVVPTKPDRFTSTWPRPRVCVCARDSS